MTLDDIGKQAEAFFEFPTENRDHVTTTSCMLFARHIAEQSTAHKQEQCDQLAHEVLRLEQELAEFKQWQKEDHAKLVQQVQTIDALEQQLSRYAGAVEISASDSWVCQICGRKTPQQLRGHNKPSSPELDHIIPISKGGAHTPSNLQCACRRCNGIKSNNTEAGQLRLL